MREKGLVAILIGVLAAGAFVFLSSGYALKASAGKSVRQYHNGLERDGVYADPSLTKASAAGFHADPAFKARIPGAVYAQLLYFAGPGGKGEIIAASEQDVVAAFDAATGRTLWQKKLGHPVPLSRLPCGDIDPLGITGTPVISKKNGTIYLDAMVTPDGGKTKKHLVFALSLKDGHVLRGWPVDISARARYGKLRFNSGYQNQRGALALVKGTLYVPYGGHFGDCGPYHGWLVSIPVSHPANIKAWATGAQGGGSWAPGGVAADGSDVFISTGNTKNTANAAKWAGGEAVIRFRGGPVFSGSPKDFFAPENWRQLDAADTDLGGEGPVLVDLPGSRPTRLIIALGKDGKIYLINRDNMGGIGRPVAVARVAGNALIGSAAAYTTDKGTYVAFAGKGLLCPAGQSGDFMAVRIIPGAPPSVRTAWCAWQNGRGSPMVTTTNGHSEAIVWSAGAEGDNRLHGFDGNTGRVVYSGSGSGNVIGKVRRFQSPVLAGGRIYIAADGIIKAFAR